MKSLLVLVLLVATHVSARRSEATFVGLVKQYCTELNAPDGTPERSTWTGPRGPRGRRGIRGIRGPPGSINETRIRGIVHEEIQRVMPIFRNISQVLLDDEPIAQKMMRKYMSTLPSGGEGWTVFQRRLDGSVNFYRGWDDYVDGFGNKSGEFWLGLHRMHMITRSAVHEMRIDMIERDGTPYFAQYENFEIGTADDNYSLRISGYSGNASDGLTFRRWVGNPRWHNGKSFSTHDADHDGCSRCSCAADYKGGWWYHDCLHSNLNGEYHRLSEQGIYWREKLMRFVEMKFRIRSL